MKFLFIAATLLATVLAPVWAINKCKSPDGKVSYQEAACDGAEKVNLSGAGRGDPSSPVANQWKRVIARQAREERAETAISEGKIFIGMSAEDARRSWGAPSKINASIGSYGKHEQWVYERDRHQTQYVYVENGVVSSMQSPE